MPGLDQRWPTQNRHPRPNLAAPKLPAGWQAARPAGGAAQGRGVSRHGSAGTARRACQAARREVPQEQAVTTTNRRRCRRTGRPSKRWRSSSACTRCASSCGQCTDRPCSRPGTISSHLSCRCLSSIRTTRSEPIAAQTNEGPNRGPRRLPFALPPSKPRPRRRIDADPGPRQQPAPDAHAHRGDAAASPTARSADCSGGAVAQSKRAQVQSCSPAAPPAPCAGAAWRCCWRCREAWCW